MSRWRGARVVGELGARTAGRLGVRVGGLLAAVAAGLGGVLATATPAAGHGADAPAGSDYRATVTGLTPAVPGLTVRVVEAGSRLELVNRTGQAIEVLGYAGEPFLEIRPDGVYENTLSPTTYRSRTLDGATEPPPEADPTRPPMWRRVDTAPRVRWHDQRIRWLSATPPPQVTAAPDRPHRVADWTVPLRAGTTEVELRGTLDWVPPPDPLPWWTLSLLGGLAVGALGLLSGWWVPSRAATAALAGLAGLGGAAAVCFALGRAADAGPDDLLGVLVTAQLWPLLTGLGALAAGAYALTRRPATDFALALAGACLALFTGVTNAAVFVRSVVPLPWPAWSARLLVAVAIAVGGGLTLAGVLRLRAAAHTARTNPNVPTDQPVPAT